MIVDVCEKIVDYTKNEILCRSSFMSAAIKYVDFLPHNGTLSFAVYENKVYYNTNFLIKTFSIDNGRTLSRFFLHCIFHFVCGNTSAENRENDSFVRLAGDIMIEKIIDEIFVFNTRDSFYDVSKSDNSYRRKVYSYISSHTKMMNEKRIHKMMVRKNTNLFEVFDKNMLLREFTFDTELTMCEETKRKSNVKEQMEKYIEIRENAKKAAKFIKIKSGISGKGDISYLLDLCYREKKDYREFLRKFAVLTERQAEDNDTFDYALYNYGNTELGAPIIEAVEYSQGHTLDGFVIAIDTSASCSVDKVRRFIKISCEIIRESLDMSSQVNITVIQCDCKIRDIKYIKSVADIDEYVKKLKVIGGGGTDFTPVFDYIEASGQFIRGLIYFTDGNGKFPYKVPDFETAFVFIDSDKDANVPRWVKKVTVDEEEI